MTTVNLTANTNDVVSQLEKINATLLTTSDNSKKTSKETADAAKEATNKWTELNSKIEVFNKVIQDGLGYLTQFKDIILEMEGFQTQATALSLLSKEGENLNDVLKQSVEITKGVVNEYDLLAVTNKLMMEGFNLSEEALAKLIDVSATYSSTTGESVASVMEKIAQASQSSKDVLDGYALSIGTTVDKLDEATKSSVLLDAATTAMKEKFDDLGLSAASLESPITHTLKSAETAMIRAKDTAVGLAASIYVDLVNSFEFLFLKASGMTNEALWKIQDESDAKNIMAALTSEMNKLVADEADKLVKFSKLPFQEQEKLREQSTKDTEEFAAKQEELLNKVQALKDQVGVGALGDAYGFISQDTANLIQKLESDVAKIGTKAVQKSEMIKAMAKETQTSWVNFADLPEEKKDDSLKEKIDDEKSQKIEYALWEESLIKDLEIAKEEARAREIEEVINYNRLYEEAVQEHQEKLKQIAEKQVTNQQHISDKIKELDIDIFNKKWQSVLDFDEKYRANIELSAEEVDKMTKKELETRLGNEAEFYEAKDRMQEIGLNTAADFSAMLINDVLMGEKEFRLSMVADFVKSIGTQMIADGTFHALSGVAKGWAGIPTGWAEAKAGAVEVAAGIGLGGVGKVFGAGEGSDTEGTSKSTAAEDRNKFNQQNQATMDVYLYPDEKHYLRTLNKSFGKIGGKK